MPDTQPPPPSAWANPQVLSAIRYALTSLMMFGTGRHWFSVAQGADLVSGVMNAWPYIVPLALSAWGVIRASKTSRTASVQASPTEQVLTTDPAVAKASPGVVLVDKLPPAAPAPIAPKP